MPTISNALVTWRLIKRSDGILLSVIGTAVESLGREYFAHVERVEREAQEETGDAVAGKAVGKEQGTTMIRQGWDDEVLAETPKRSAVFDRKIRNMGGRRDGGSRCEART